MGLDKILVTSKKLNNIDRWATELMHQHSTVSQHSFSVAQICQMLGLIEECNGNKIDWGKLLKKAINHDVIEGLTGDIISIVKHRTEAMKNMVSAVEEQVAKEMLLDTMQEPYKSIYKELLFDGKDNTIEGQLLCAADKIDALYECINEMKLANYNPFTERYFELVENLKEMDRVSVKYFLDNILGELTKGIPIAK